jgi:KaiC/GvpD/RAD55 family RecA-like ATPase
MSATDLPPTSVPPPGPSHSHAADVREAAREELFGGARLVVADMRVAYLLLNQARARVITRMFGITGPGSGLVTIIALGIAAETAQRTVRRALAAPGAPELGQAALGASVLTESARWIAGPGTGEFPLFGPLILLAVAGHVMRPAVRSTVHSVRTSAHRAHSSLDHRYGHIIRRNRPRPESVG